jgi:hypothetical protein
MANKIIMNLLFVSLMILSCHCEEDTYGEVLDLVIPITTHPDKDTFHIGDTIWMEAQFNKDIRLLNSTKTIRLEAFTFFTDLGIAEISGETENYQIDIDTIAEIGAIDYLPLHGALAYSLTFVEEEHYYVFKGAVVLKSKGLFYLFFSTNGRFYEAPFYDHPKLYVCKDDRRDRVNVHYDNPSTSHADYENFFRKTQVDNLLDLYDYEKYKNLGTISFMVL